MAQQDMGNAADRSDDRRRKAEQRAEIALQRVSKAQQEARKARKAGNARAAAVHEHEAVVHQRAVEIHLQAAKLQQQHRLELETVFASRGAMDASGLRLIADNVRRARDEAEVRSEQARTYAFRARERAQKLHVDRRSNGPDA